MPPSEYTPEQDQRSPSAAESFRTVLLEALPKQSVCAEIGVWKGEFSQRILKVTRPRMLHLIDPWAFQPRYPARWYGGGDAKNQADMDVVHESVVRRFQANQNVMVHRMTSIAAAEYFSDATFDWVYIDGDHSYDAVKQDLAAWWPKLKAGGLLAGDDLNWPGEDGSRPVLRALRDFMVERGIGKARVKNNQFVIRSNRTHKVSG